MCSCLNTTDQREKLFCPFRFSRLTLVLYYLSSHCFMSGNYYDLQVLCLMRFSMMVVVSIHRGLKDEKISITYIYTVIFFFWKIDANSHTSQDIQNYWVSSKNLVQYQNMFVRHLCLGTTKCIVCNRFQFFTYCVYSWYKVP